MMEHNGVRKSYLWPLYKLIFYLDAKSLQKNGAVKSPHLFLNTCEICKLAHVIFECYYANKYLYMP